ncbi:MAG: hypothetical protein R2754_14760 [Microthrixaceae bacterium]
MELRVEPVEDLGAQKGIDIEFAGLEGYAIDAPHSHVDAGMRVRHHEHGRRGPPSGSVQDQLCQGQVALTHLGQERLDLCPVKPEICCGELDKLAANPTLVEPERWLNSACGDQPAGRAEAVEQCVDHLQRSVGAEMVEVVEHENDVATLVQVECNRRRELLDLDGGRRTQESVEATTAVPQRGSHAGADRSGQHVGVVVLGVETHPHRSPARWGRRPGREGRRLPRPGRRDDQHKGDSLDGGGDPIRNREIRRMRNDIGSLELPGGKQHTEVIHYSTETTNAARRLPPQGWPRGKV